MGCPCGGWVVDGAQPRTGATPGCGAPSHPPKRRPPPQKTAHPHSPTGPRCRGGVWAWSCWLPYLSSSASPGSPKQWELSQMALPAWQVCGGGGGNRAGRQGADRRQHGLRVRMAGRSPPPLPACRSTRVPDCAHGASGDRLLPAGAAVSQGEEGWLASAVVAGRQAGGASNACCAPTRRPLPSLLVTTTHSPRSPAHAQTHARAVAERTAWRDGAGRHGAQQHGPAHHRCSCFLRVCGWGGAGCQRTGQAMLAVLWGVERPTRGPHTLSHTRTRPLRSTS